MLLPLLLTAGSLEVAGLVGPAVVAADDAHDASLPRMRDASDALR